MAGITVGIMAVLVVIDLVKKKDFSKWFVYLAVFAIFFGASAFLNSLSLIDDVRGILDTDTSGVLVEGFLGDDFGVSVFFLVVSIMSLWGYILLRKRDREISKQAQDGN